MEESQILEKLGFTKNEIKIYYYLLKNKESTTGPLMTKLGISSSRVYASIEKLKKENLISEVIINNKRYLKASNPKIINEKINTLKEETKLLINKLSQLEPIKEEESPIIFKGKNGYRNFYNTISDIYDKNNEILVIEYTQNMEISNTARNLILKLSKQRQKMKIPLKIILHENLRNTFGKIREKEEYIQIRYINKEIKFESALSIYKDYIVNISWDNKDPVIYMIQNKKIANTHKEYFKILWEIGKK